MHLVAAEIGLLPTTAIIGAGIPIAAGAAFAAQVKGSDHVAVSVFGDGATNIGAFHEALNLAAIWHLPVVFVCENNLYGEYTPIQRSMLVTDIHKRATAYGLPGVQVDGMDVCAVESAIAEAVERARQGEGPSLVEAKTYRFSGHSRGDPAKYRAPGELEHWQGRDPIIIAEQQLREAGCDELLLAKARADATATIAKAVDFAKASAPPDPGDMFAHVFAEPVDAQHT